jgi:Abortive infection C-terminus
LHDEFIGLAQRLEAGTGVTNPTPVHTSEFVEKTLAEVEHAIMSNRETSGVDRVHSALHGYLRHVCDEADIEDTQDDKIIDLFKKLLAEHGALQDLGPRPQDTATITRAFCGIMAVIDPRRNRASFAHPTPALLGVPEAMLVINAAKTILHYVEAKLVAVAAR